MNTARPCGDPYNYQNLVNTWDFIHKCFVACMRRHLEPIYAYTSVSQQIYTTRAMSEVPDVLRQHATWAREAIGHVLGKHGANNGALLWGKNTIGTTSMFSGVGFPERALAFVDAARRMHCGDSPPLTVTWP